MHTHIGIQSKRHGVCLIKYTNVSFIRVASYYVSVYNNRNLKGPYRLHIRDRCGFYFRIKQNTQDPHQPMTKFRSPVYARSATTIIQYLQQEEEKQQQQQ